VYFIHRTGKRVQLGTSLTSFLKLALKAAENVVEGDAALAWYSHIGAHAAHTSERLLLKGGATGRASGILSSSKVESRTIA